MCYSWSWSSFASTSTQKAYLPSLIGAMGLTQLLRQESQPQYSDFQLGTFRLPKGLALASTNCEWTSVPDTVCTSARTENGW